MKVLNRISHFLQFPNLDFLSRSRSSSTSGETMPTLLGPLAGGPSWQQNANFSSLQSGSSRSVGEFFWVSGGILGSGSPLWGKIFSWGNEGKDWMTFVKPPFSSNGTRAESWDGGMIFGSITELEKEFGWPILGERVPAWSLFPISLNEWPEGVFESGWDAIRSPWFKDRVFKSPSWLPPMPGFAESWSWDADNTPVTEGMNAMRWGVYWMKNMVSKHSCKWTGFQRKMPRPKREEIHGIKARKRWPPLICFSLTVG